MHTDTNTLDNNENQNCEENERSIKPAVVYLRRLEQRYMGEQVERRDEPVTTTPVVGKKTYYSSIKMKNTSKMRVREIELSTTQRKT